jgi:putative FmdB family regulatory protein
MIYEYECPKCGRTFERWSNKVRDGEWTELCPDDGSTSKRIISASNFVLKGGGWARDGYDKTKKGTRKDVPREVAKSPESHTKEV